MVQFEMVAIYSTGLDKTDGNEVLPGRGFCQERESQELAQTSRGRQGTALSGAQRASGSNPCSVTS